MSENGTGAFLHFWTAENLTRFPWLAHGVTARTGGVSVPPYKSLNLGAHVGDDPESVQQNRRIVAEAMGFRPEAMVCSEQVHGTAVAVVTGPHSDPIPQTDALITNTPGLLLTLFFADCLPVLFVASEQRAIGLAHAGWRGLAGGVLENTVERLIRNYGATVETLQVAIGPGIGPCCFEVGDEVAAVFPEDVARKSDRGKPRVNLPAAARRRLVALGIPAGNVLHAEACTSCLPERYFSHRRDSGKTGRMAALLGIQVIPED
ncbi:MAG: peptidoglycan editing factor PgeF [Armatimonadaceae bacterium]